MVLVTKEPFAGHILTYNLNSREKAVYVCLNTYAVHELLKPGHSGSVRKFLLLLLSFCRELR